MPPDERARHREERAEHKEEYAERKACLKACREACARAKVPEPVVEATEIVLLALSPPPPPEWIVERLQGPESREVRAAYKAGERDPGRLTFLVAAHAIGLETSQAWDLVPVAAAQCPGRVDPQFVAQAQQQRQVERTGAVYGGTPGGTKKEEPFGEKAVPFVLIGLGVACVFLVKNLIK